jgi:signal transduction histidine kinase/ActR/RegA family two-component response regulator
MPPTIRASVTYFVKNFLPQNLKDLAQIIAFFFIYFVVTKIFLFVFIEYQTSPALILPQIGLALAGMLLFGYKLWPAILFGHLIAIVTTRPDIEVLALVIACGYALQIVVSVFVMREFGFTMELNRLKNILILVSVALVLTTIEPTIATIGQMMLTQLDLSPIHNWARAWGAGVFSVIVITPFLLSWYPSSKVVKMRSHKERLEVVAAFLLLIAVNYLVFWTLWAQVIGIVVIFLLPAVLMWFAMRLHPQWLTLAIFVTAIQGIGGAIIAQVSPSPVNEQLVAIEIYIGLVAAMLYMLAGIVEERRDAFRKLKQAYEASVASDKAKNDFIAILAHELRNPLAPVMSSLEFMKLQSKDPQLDEVIDNTLVHTDMMRHLLDDLLDMARLVQGKITLRKEHVELRSIMEHSIASVVDHAKSKNITLRYELPPARLRVSADPIRLKQIIMNLLNNACKYTQKGGTVELLYGINTDQLFISIKDNGVGIAPELQERIFEPFRQVGNAVRYGTGLGVGLYLTKSLVEMHQGTIEVISEGADKGSTFTIYLPYKQEAQPQVSIPTIMNPQTKKILIVDDNEAAANILQKLLTLHKHEVDVAYSGKGALEKASTFTPDVIFLDIGMPEMDGYQTAQKLREDGWKGPIVALSGYGQESDKQQSKEAGFDHHLVKPVGIDDILALLSTLRQPQAA